MREEQAYRVEMATIARSSASVDGRQCPRHIMRKPLSLKSPPIPLFIMVWGYHPGHVFKHPEVHHVCVGDPAPQCCKVLQIEVGEVVGRLPSSRGLQCLQRPHFEGLSGALPVDLWPRPQVGTMDTRHQGLLNQNGSLVHEGVGPHVVHLVQHPSPGLHVQGLVWPPYGCGPPLNIHQQRLRQAVPVVVPKRFWCGGKLHCVRRQPCLHLHLAEDGIEEVCLEHRPCTPRSEDAAVVVVEHPVLVMPTLIPVLQPVNGVVGDCSRELRPCGRRSLVNIQGNEIPRRDLVIMVIFIY